MNSPAPPQSPEPDQLLAIARQELARGALEPAQQACMRVLSAEPRHAAALDLLGEILLAQGRHDDAVRVYHALTLWYPQLARYWQNLGTVLRPAGRHAEALAAFERALQLAGPNPGLLYNLGVLQMDRSDYDAAYLALRDGSRLAPSDGPLRWAYAQCCFDCGRLDEALEALEGWEELAGLSEDFRVRIVLLLAMLGAIEREHPAVQGLLSKPPRHGRAALGTAAIMERLHLLEAARKLMEEPDTTATAAESDDRTIILGVLAARSGRHEEAREYLERALQNHREFVHRHKVLFPLAQEYDRLGRYEEAYATAMEAHRSQLALLERMTGRSAAEDSKLWTLTSGSCDPADVASWTDAGPAVEDSPVFVVGFPRSGTTLLEQILDAHPLLRSMDERPFLGTAVEEIMQRGVRYPAGLGALTRADLDAIRAAYWQRVHKRVRLGPGQRLVDKNPLNMNMLPAIRRLFPQAPIVLLVRHPCDTLLSCFLQDFRSAGLALLCRDLPTLARAYASTFGFWHSQHPLLRPRTHEVMYEKLAAELEAQVRGLCSFLGLPWEEAMLSPGKHALDRGFIRTPSYSQVIQPVNSRAVGRWRNYERHFGDALQYLKPWIAHWGYDRG